MVVGTVVEKHGEEYRVDIGLYQVSTTQRTRNVLSMFVVANLAG